MRCGFIARFAAIAGAVLVTAYLALCWHIHAAMGDLTIAEDDDYQSLLAKIGPPTDVLTDANAGARWTNFRGSGWELFVDTRRFEPNDPVDFAAIQRIFFLNEAYYVEYEIPKEAGDLTDFFAAPMRCRILLRA